MPAILTATTERLLADVNELVTEDIDALSGLPLLNDTEALITAQRKIDYALSRRLNRIWDSEATVIEVGRSVKGWLVDEQHLSPGDATSRITVARDLLLSGREHVADAMACGEIGIDHAKTITQTLRKFPLDEQDMAEKHLVDASKEVDPSSLGKACRDLREQLDLDADADAAYAALYGSRYLKTSSTIDGMVKLDAMLDPVTGAALKTALASLSAKQGAEDDRTKPQRDHDALGSIINLALRTGSLPEHGGAAPQVVVSTPLFDLVHGLDDIRVPSARIEDEPIPPSVIRMLACDAGIVPVVLGGQSEVLDLGRSTRTWTKAQRIAARVRDGDTCTWPDGCNTPIRYCELHHIEFWTEHQGPTDHRNSAHVCGFHHWLVHNRNWALWRDPDGTLRHRRT